LKMHPVNFGYLKTDKCQNDLIDLIDIGQLFKFRAGVKLNNCTFLELKLIKTTNFGFKLYKF